MMWRGWMGAFLCGLLLFGCGKEEVESSTPGNSLLQQLAAARNMSAQETLSPAKHFWLLGEIRFHTDGGDIKQDAELWLAGAQRMSFQIGPPRERNDFRLFDAEHCWLKVVGGQFQSYDPTELLLETALRWAVLRFPWGWEQAVASAQTEATKGLRLSLQRSTPWGLMTLETDSLGLPLRASLGSSSVKLAGWKTALQIEALAPHQWSWQARSGKRSERFDSIRGQALFHDQAFRPVHAPALSIGKLESALQEDLSLGDDFGVLQLDLRYLNVEEYQALQEPLPRGRWWQVDEERFFVALPEAPKAALQQPVQVPWRNHKNQLWLRWSTYADVTVEKGIRSLAAVMEQTGYHATGPCWALEVPKDGRQYRHVFLMPVEKD